MLKFTYCYRITYDNLFMEKFLIKHELGVMRYVGYTQHGILNVDFNYYSFLLP